MRTVLLLDVPLLLTRFAGRDGAPGHTAGNECARFGVEGTSETVLLRAKLFTNALTVINEDILQMKNEKNYYKINKSIFVCFTIFCYFLLSIIK